MAVAPPSAASPAKQKARPASSNTPKAIVQPTQKAQPDAVRYQAWTWDSQISKTVSWAPAGDEEPSENDDDAASVASRRDSSNEDTGAGLIATWKEDEAVCVATLSSLKHSSGTLAENIRRETNENLKHIRNDMPMSKTGPIAVESLAEVGRCV